MRNARTTISRRGARTRAGLAAELARQTLDTIDRTIRGLRDTARTSTGIQTDVREGKNNIALTILILEEERKAAQGRLDMELEALSLLSADPALQTRARFRASGDAPLLPRGSFVLTCRKKKRKKTKLRA